MIYAIIQARMCSTRLPNKVFKNIVGKPLLWHVIDRLKFSKTVDDIIVATTTNEKDNKIYKWSIKNNIKVFRGDEFNVVKRYYDTANFFNLKDDDIIIRITSDDPFKDPYIIDNMIFEMKNKKIDFIYNNNPVSFPEGLDVEIFNFSMLKHNINLITDKFDQEHVTQYFYKLRNINKFNFSNDVDLSYLRWTIDTHSDLKMVRKIYKLLYKENYIFNTQDILNLIKDHQDIPKINSEIKRSFMYEKN
jgi:spore coat polysaccharide biosynthesis protein SpsF